MWAEKILILILAFFLMGHVKKVRNNWHFVFLYFWGKKVFPNSLLVKIIYLENLILTPIDCAMKTVA